MSFFIRGKQKKERSDNSKRKRRDKTISSSLSKKRKSHEDENEEISSDLEEDTKLDNEYVPSSDSEIEETAQMKKVRLATKYLNELYKEEKKRIDANEIDSDIIAQRLRVDFLNERGRYRKLVAHLVTGHGEFVSLSCKEHSRSITCFVVSTDDKFLYSASDDFNIVKWSLEKRKKLGVIKRTDKNGHKKKILALAISTDNKFLVSGDNEGKLRVWNANDLTFVHTFSGHKSSITGLAFRKDTLQLFSCSTDKTVKIWNLNEMMYVETLYGHMSGVTAIDVLAKDRAITSGGSDNSLRIWKVPEESHLILNGHNESIDCVKLLNEEYFVSGDQGGNVSLWNSSRKKPLHTIQTSHGIDETNSMPNWILSLATYMSSDLFASAGYNGAINLYKVHEKKHSFEKFREINLAGNVNCLSFTSDGNYLIAGIGQEHKLGRWHTNKAVKNGIILIPLIKEKND